MNISSVTPYQVTSSQTMKVEASEKRAFKLPEAVATTPEKKPSTIYGELSSQYDVRNATFEEIVELSKALYEVGEISLAEHATLTFDYGRATNYLQQNAPGVPSSFNMYETSADHNGRRDWIAEFEARASKSFQFGNLIGYQSNTKIVELLEGLSR